MVFIQIKNRSNDLRTALCVLEVESKSFFFFCATFSGSALEPSFRGSVFRLETNSMSNDWTDTAFMELMNLTLAAVKCIIGEDGEYLVIKIE